jgi:hypothetical protein
MRLVMRFPALPANPVFCQIVCGLTAFAPAGDGDWKKHIKPNVAYLRAKQRPTFSVADPVGLVTSESGKEQQHQAAGTLRAAVQRISCARCSRRMKVMVSESQPFTVCRILLCGVVNPTRPPSAVKKHWAETIWEVAEVAWSRNLPGI